MREAIGVPQEAVHNSGNHACTYTSICEHFGKSVSSLVTWRISVGRCGDEPGAVPGAVMGASMGCAV